MTRATKRIGFKSIAGAAVSAVFLLLTGCGGDGGDAPANAEAYPHATETIGSLRDIYDGKLKGQIAVNTFRNADRLLTTRDIKHGGTSYAMPKSAQQLSQISFTFNNKVYDLPTYLETQRVTGLLILKDGKIVNETYREGNTEKTRWISFSMAKSISSILIGAALRDGFITSINDPVVKYVPQLAGTAYDGVTVRNVLMMATGVKWDETYNNPNSDIRALVDARISQTPGASIKLLSKLPRVAQPGYAFNYSTGDTQIVGEILYGATKIRPATYLSNKIWTKMGMEADAKWWTDSPDGMETTGSGLSATLRDYGRIGLFMLNDGIINDERILPSGWISDSTTPKTLADGTLNSEYGYLWWIPSGPSKGDGAYYAAGIHGQNIYVNPKHKIVIVTWEAWSDSNGSGDDSYDKNNAFFEAAVKALSTAN